MFRRCDRLDPVLGTFEQNKGGKDKLIGISAPNPFQIYRKNTPTNTFSKILTAKMVLKVYGSAMATSRVLVTLLEKELPYEFVLIDIAKGDQKSEEYKKLQPFGKVPALDDDGFLMFESRAICKYLAK